MEPIYIIGHQNPDTDSVVSAIAYASLKNSLGERTYMPAVLGEISDQTKRVLSRFNFDIPPRLTNVRTQVRDLEFDTPPILSSAVSIGHAWKIFREGTSPALPVADEDGKLFGMLTKGDIAQFIMETLDCPEGRDIPLFNILNMLDGTLLNDCGSDSVSFSSLAIALYGQETYQESFENAIVICGDQPDVLERAAKEKAACVILCRARTSPEMLSALKDIFVINTPLDAFRASRVIYDATPVSRVCNRDNLVSFHLDDYIDTVRELTLQSRFRSYPILDENDKVVGTLSRFHLLRPKRKKVILVDHNEISQSVLGLEQAEILEIIDHHRLADVQTLQPIYFRNEPVGSTATIIAELYQESGLAPSPKMAGLLASAILSDTVIFKSPTCTARDEQIAKRLERISGISLTELGKDMFSFGSNLNDVKEMLYSDFKEFHIGGHTLGIGQITCMNSVDVLEMSDEFLGCMKSEAEAYNYDIMLLMITDVLKNGTEIIAIGDSKIINQAFNVELTNSRAFLPGILSRKKQIVPALSMLWG